MSSNYFAIATGLMDGELKRTNTSMTFGTAVTLFEERASFIRQSSKSCSVSHFSIASSSSTCFLAPDNPHFSCNNTLPIRGVAFTRRDVDVIREFFSTAHLRSIISIIWTLYPIESLGDYNLTVWMFHFQMMLIILVVSSTLSFTLNVYNFLFVRRLAIYFWFCCASTTLDRHSFGGRCLGHRYLPHIRWSCAQELGSDLRRCARESSICARSGN